MRYILAEGKGQGEFFGHVYRCKGKMYRHQGLLFEIEETDTGWKDAGPFLKSTTGSLNYVGGLYAWCNRDLELNTLPFKELPKALQAAFNSFKLEDLECSIKGRWRSCLIRPKQNLIVRLRKQKPNFPTTIFTSICICLLTNDVFLHKFIKIRDTYAHRGYAVLVDILDSFLAWLNSEEGEKIVSEVTNNLKNDCETQNELNYYIKDAYKK